MALQKTLRTGVRLEGPTLWGNGHACINMYPMDTDTGIVLRRTDVKPAFFFPLSIYSTRVDDRKVVLQAEAGSSVTLSFVEHLLAALWGMGIDNVRVDVEGDELPFFDGSSLAYVKAIFKAGILRQGSEREELEIENSLLFTSSRGFIFIRPSERLQISYVFYNWDSGWLRARCFADVEKAFVTDIAPARTFAVGDYPDFEYPFGIRSSRRRHYPYPTRFPDEMLRHKALDLLGDLALLGYRIKANIWAVGTGHRETHQVVKLLTKEIEYGKLKCGLDPLKALPPISIPDG
ncbi:UDP-3-O-acyl-N-acetylglucosamine deacetylase [candidate division WOR-3 bacterium]|nr:UDP-3-O-acyl-N-acetylglucosamine deacetylase [candidate division WOR-3 bacterium]